MTVRQHLINIALRLHSMWTNMVEHVRIVRNKTCIYCKITLVIGKLTQANVPFLKIEQDI